MKQLIIIIFTFTNLLFSNTSYAKENQIQVESENLIVNQNPATSIFTGDVYAYDNEINLWSDKVIITFIGPNNEIDTIEGQGNVRLIRDGEEINADYIFYNLRDSSIRAKGNIVAKQEGSVINGDELDIDLKNSTSVIKSKKRSRVKAIIIKKDD